MSPITLCPTCIACLSYHQGLQTLENHPSSLMFFHHFQPQTLQDSATAKCPICRPLWSQLEPLQSKIPYKVSDKQPLTFLLLQPSENFGGEGSYELAAYLNDEATTVDGIEHGSILMFLLQDRRGRLSMCLITQLVYHQADQAGRLGEPLQLHEHVNINGISGILGYGSEMAPEVQF